MQQSLNTGSLKVRPVGGGSINETYRLDSETGSFFCKLNSATKFPHLFEKEKRGLQALARSESLVTPEVLGLWEEDSVQVLLLRWIEPARPTPLFWRRLGEGLARLHQEKGPAFGWEEDNYMGSAVQENGWKDRWTDFLRERRFRPLVTRCRQAGLLNKEEERAFEHLYQALPRFFEDRAPALLHGDLWSGNFLCGPNDSCWLIDPAAHYGHPAMDLGLTRLFGGFDPLFYEVYYQQSPPPPHHREQEEVCQLYPLLIHLLLFGHGYRGSVLEILRRFS